MKTVELMERYAWLCPDCEEINYQEHLDNKVLCVHCIKAFNATPPVKKTHAISILDMKNNSLVLLIESKINEHTLNREYEKAHNLINSLAVCARNNGLKNLQRYYLSRAKNAREKINLKEGSI